MKKMIKTLITSIWSLCFFVLWSCSTSMPVSQSRGIANTAYLVFISASENVGKNVEVTINENTNFIAKTIKQKDANVSGNGYAIEPGSCIVTVKRDGKVLYRKKAFVNPRETKMIQLP